jgi:hypothetical protein
MRQQHGFAYNRVLSHPNGCFSSPADRAMKTGRIVLREMGIQQELISVTGLLEQSSGKAEGAARKSIWTFDKEQELKDLYAHDPDKAWDFMLAEGAQTPREAGMEMVNWMSQLDPGGYIAFVHRSKTLYAAGCIINMLCGQSSSKWPQDIIASAVFSNCDGYVFERRNGVWQIPNLLFCSPTIPMTGFPVPARFIKA